MVTNKSGCNRYRARQALIKVGNVWYPKSQAKLAKQVAFWIYKAWLTEMRKRRKHKMVTLNGSNNNRSFNCRR